VSQGRDGHDILIFLRVPGEERALMRFDEGKDSKESGVFLKFVGRAAGWLGWHFLKQ
jgi:hypothetical protein